MKIQCFIFNWRGQYDKAIATEQALIQAGQSVTVINSDPDNQPDHWINLGDTAYFTKQWLSACDRFDADIMFHVQADATYNNWPALFSDAEKYFEKYNCGIYAPNVDYTWYDGNQADVTNVQLADPGLKLVSNPDCTCWFLHKSVINSFKELPWDWSFHNLGWGVDLLVCGYSYLQHKLIIRDYNHTIDHPKGTKYNSSKAELEMVELFNRCNDDMKRVIHCIRNNKPLLVEYIK